MRKVLFVDYFFPPLAADWRGTAFAKLLPEFGWQPIVVSADESVSYGKDYYLLKEIPENLEVHRVPHREPSPLWQRIRHKLKISADFPDYYRTWYSPACREARKILSRQKVHLIYSASPTFTTAFVAMKLKKEFNIPWIADFLDGWAVNDFLKEQYDRTLIAPLRRFHMLRIKKAERRILESADKVVVIHRHVKQRWYELHGIDETKVRVIADGYDESVFRGLKVRFLYPDRLTIVFLGSFYPAFREIIIRFAGVVNELDRDAELVFIGRGAVAVQGMNLPNSTCILQLSRKRAIEFALGCDFLLLVMPPFAKWTPSKIYDYLRIGRPILAIVPHDGDAARILQESNGGFVLPFDEQQMKKELGTIFERRKRGELEGFQPDQEYITKFERRKLTEQMAEVFDEISP